MYVISVAGDKKYHKHYAYIVINNLKEHLHYACIKIKSFYIFE